NMPRPKGADAAGLLLRELELHPPSEEWHKRNMSGGGGWWDESPDRPDAGVCSSSSIIYGSSLSSEGWEMRTLWPRKRRLSERDAAFGLNTSVGLGAYYGIMGSRRDVVTAVWKTGIDGVWYKCVRCLRQTCALAGSSPVAASGGGPEKEKELWWVGRWAYGCPMCGGAWVRVV
ncbi:hypothetical protein M569_16157, partial [Genlisea aurea]